MGAYCFLEELRSICWYLWALQVAESTSEERGWLQRFFNILLCDTSGNFSFTKTDRSPDVYQCFTQSTCLNPSDFRAVG